MSHSAEKDAGPEAPFCTVCKVEILYGSRCHDHPGYCLPSLGEPCGSCHRCVTAPGKTQP